MKSSGWLLGLHSIWTSSQEHGKECAAKHKPSRLWVGALASGGFACTFSSGGISILAQRTQKTLAFSVSFLTTRLCVSPLPLTASPSLHWNYAGSSLQRSYEKTPERSQNRRMRKRRGQQLAAVSFPPLTKPERCLARCLKRAKGPKLKTKKQNKS